MRKIFIFFGEAQKTGGFFAFSFFAKKDKMYFFFQRERKSTKKNAASVAAGDGIVRT